MWLFGPTSPVEHRTWSDWPAFGSLTRSQSDGHSGSALTKKPNNLGLEVSSSETSSGGGYSHANDLTFKMHLKMEPTSVDHQLLCGLKNSQKRARKEFPELAHWGRGRKLNAINISPLFKDIRVLKKTLLPRS